MLAANVVVLPNYYEVRFHGCEHLQRLPASMVVPAHTKNDNRMLFCSLCFADRQWRLIHEEPATRHGSPFRPSQRLTSAP